MISKRELLFIFYNAKWLRLFRMRCIQHRPCNATLNIQPSRRAVSAFATRRCLNSDQASASAVTLGGIADGVDASGHMLMARPQAHDDSPRPARRSFLTVRDSGRARERNPGPAPPDPERNSTIARSRRSSAHGHRGTRIEIDRAARHHGTPSRLLAPRLRTRVRHRALSPCGSALSPGRTVRSTAVRNLTATRIAPRTALARSPPRTFNGGAASFAPQR